MQIPEDIGKGYYRRIALNPSMDIYLSDITFNKSMEMGGNVSNPTYCLIFCLGDAFQWRAEENKKEYEIKCWESYIYSTETSEMFYTDIISG